MRKKVFLEATNTDIEDLTRLIDKAIRISSKEFKFEFNITEQLINDVRYFTLTMYIIFE